MSPQRKAKALEETDVPSTGLTGLFCTGRPAYGLSGGRGDAIDEEAFKA
jgi:hypothetical protein